MDRICLVRAIRMGGHRKVYPCKIASIYWFELFYVTKIIFHCLCEDSQQLASLWNLVGKVTFERTGKPP